MSKPWSTAAQGVRTARGCRSAKCTRPGAWLVLWNLPLHEMWRQYQSTIPCFCCIVHCDSHTPQPPALPNSACTMCGWVQLQPSCLRNSCDTLLLHVWQTLPMYTTKLTVDTRDTLHRPARRCRSELNSTCLAACCSKSTICPHSSTSEPLTNKQQSTLPPSVKVTPSYVAPS